MDSGKQATSGDGSCGRGQGLEEEKVSKREMACCGLGAAQNRVRQSSSSSQPSTAQHWALYRKAVGRALEAATEAGPLRRPIQGAEPL